MKVKHAQSTDFLHSLAETEKSWKSIRNMKLDISSVWGLTNFIQWLFHNFALFKSLIPKNLEEAFGACRLMHKSSKFWLEKWEICEF